MATEPGGGAVVGSSRATPQKPFWSCFSCRVVAGSGLMGAGLWVHLGARQSLRQKRPGNLFDIFRLAFAIGLYSGAIVTVFDPVQLK